jgi:hypothetical protein
MSQSYRDQKPRYLAARRFGIGLNDDKPLPRIIERKSRKGDIHPLNARLLRGALRLDVPLDYLYGLSRIELRARMGNEIGVPFGCYLTDEKAIILYSLPLSWCWQTAPPSLLNSMSNLGAEIISSESKISVSWSDKESLAVWLFIEVVGHELGHHFKNQYKSRQGALGSVNHEEWVADLHARRFAKRMWQRIKKRKKRGTNPKNDTES